MHHWERIKKHPDISRMMNDFTLSKYSGKIKSSVLIIHGAEDNVIPSEESVKLYNELKYHEIKTRLLITPLLGHSTLKFNPECFLSIFELFNSLSYFFKAA